MNAKPEPAPLAPVAPLEPLEIEYEVTHDDLVDASIAVARRSRSMRITSAGLLAAASTLIAVATLMTGVSVSAVITSLLAISGFVLFQLVLVPRIQREQVSATLREGRNLFLSGTQHLRLDEHGISGGNWVMESRVRWEGVERIVLTNQHVLIYYGAARSIVVPKRAFSSEEELHAFIQRANALHQSALTSGSAIRPQALPPPR